jgi:hypothetical protein
MCGCVCVRASSVIACLLTPPPPPLSLSLSLSLTFRRVCMCTASCPSLALALSSCVYVCSVRSACLLVVCPCLVRVFPTLLLRCIMGCGSMPLCFMNTVETRQHLVETLCVTMPDTHPHARLAAKNTYSRCHAPKRTHHRHPPTPPGCVLSTQQDMHGYTSHPHALTHSKTCTGMPLAPRGSGLLTAHSISKFGCSSRHCRINTVPNTYGKFLVFAFWSYMSSSATACFT